MAANAASYDDGPCAGINMTPLIDVMLVLLVMFIMTIPVMTHAVRIDNPLPSTASPAEPPRVIDLRIDFDGTLLWERRPVDRVTMQSLVVREAASSPQPEVHITVDRSARYDVVAKALSDLQFRGLRKIGIVNGDYP